MNKVSDFDKKMVNFADDIALTMSKDISTKVGAVILDENNEIVSVGYNGIPRGMNDSVEERNEKLKTINGIPVKYSWSEHAERNAIYNVGYDQGIFENKILLSHGNFDIEDLRAIISSGIKKSILIRKKVEKRDEETELLIKEMVSEYFGTVLIIEESELITDGKIEEKKLQEKFGYSSLCHLKAGKVLKFLETLNIYKESFAYEYKYKTAGGEIFTVEKTSSLIFDENSYSISSFGVSGVVNALREKVKESEEIKSISYMGSIRNVIYSAISKVSKGKSIYVNLCPCIDCSKAIVSVGIKKIIGCNKVEHEDVKARWKSSFLKTFQYLNVHGINILEAKI